MHVSSSFDAMLKTHEGRKVTGSDRQSIFRLPEKHAYRDRHHRNIDTVLSIFSRARLFPLCTAPGLSLLIQHERSGTSAPSDLMKC